MEIAVTKYRDNPGAIRSLVRGGEVHRDVYLSPELFDLEMERLWHRAWIYVGHDSQVPKTGDYHTAEIAGQPLVMIRGPDGEVRVLYNRCAHKGAKIVSAASGNCPGVLRCPYHGWTYRLDGTLRTMPLKGGYAGTGFAESAAARGLTPVAGVAIHRGFVFVRLSRGGAEFAEYFGDSLSSIDNMADRSPVGRLEVVGGTLGDLCACEGFWPPAPSRKFDRSEPANPKLLGRSHASSSRMTFRKETKPAERLVFRRRLGS